MRIALRQDRRTWGEACRTQKMMTLRVLGLSPCCCDRASTGHAAAAPPRRLMNSRRRISAPKVSGQQRNLSALASGQHGRRRTVALCIDSGRFASRRGLCRNHQNGQPRRAGSDAIEARLDALWVSRYLPTHASRPRILPTGFIAPCLPTSSPQPPIGTAWAHEIKHDGIRIIARKTEPGVHLYTRPGNDLTQRFPLIVEAVARLRARSCILDGEAVSFGDDGIAVFERIRYRHYDHTVFLYVFDLIELDGNDLRREPLEIRKATLASLLVPAHVGVRLNEHLVHANGVHVFEHACRMGLEGIVSKRKGSPYRSGRTLDWIKAKNPQSPAVTRLADEDWGWRAAKRG
jgi:bifunctional non-homologous end joining protein LigD